VNTGKGLKMKTETEARLLETFKETLIATHRGIRNGFQCLKKIVEERPGQSLLIQIEDNESAQVQWYECTLSSGRFLENSRGYCVFPTERFQVTSSGIWRPGPLKIPHALIVIGIDHPEKRWPRRDQQKRPLLVRIFIGSRHFKALLSNYLNAEARQQIAA